LVFPLVNATTSYRDRAFWLLLAASGLRCSEVKSLKWSHVNMETREIFIMDPRGLRFGRDMTREDVFRFKGRATSFTYLIYQFKEAFFEALEQYVKNEYIPPRVPGDHYIFQYVEFGRRGQPFIDASDAALAKNFRELCVNANVPVCRSGRLPTPHSLRYMYAVYMLKDFPLGNGQFGLSLVEVQMLMGHKSITTTRKYARKKKKQLQEKLEFADHELIGNTYGSTETPVSLVSND
jgi:integrase